MRSNFCTAVFFLTIMVCSFGVEAQLFQGKKFRKMRSKERAITNYKGGIRGKFRPYYFVTFNVNALNYFGDLAPVNRAASTDVSFTQPGFGSYIGYRFSPFVAFRGGFNYGRIKGDDFSSDPDFGESSGRYLRNLSFRNDIKELSAGFEIYLTPSYGGPTQRPRLNAFVFIGAAVFHHEPKGLVPDYDHTLGGVESDIPLEQAGQWVKLRPLGTEGQFLDDRNVEPYSPIQFSVPLSFGVKMKLPGNFDAEIEFGYRFLFTDYIDDVSSNFVRHDKFEDNDLARIMADRSAEKMAYVEGFERGITATGQNIDGTTYYSASGLGGGIVLADNAPGRGNPGDNDMIFMTSLKLVHILGRRSRKVPKFR